MRQEANEEFFKPVTGTIIQVLLKAADYKKWKTTQTPSISILALALALKIDPIPPHSRNCY